MRWSFLSAGGAGPFSCDGCTDKDKEARNCGNRLGLSDQARAVDDYSPEVKEELLSHKAGKVFSLKGIRLYECPLSYITRDSFDLMRSVCLIGPSGRLLMKGGWADQPYWFIEAYEIYKEESAKDIKEGSDV